MSTKQAHIKKALHNEEFAKSLNPETTPFRDWIAVGAFYSAVHFLEAFFATQNRHSDGHHIRDAMLLEFAVTQEIAPQFNELKQLGFKARYLSDPFTPGEIKNQVLPALAEIKERIMGFLATR